LALTVPYGRCMPRKVKAGKGHLEARVFGVGDGLDVLTVNRVPDRVAVQ
jgi:hypothetical protein